MKINKKKLTPIYILAVLAVLIVSVLSGRLGGRTPETEGLTTAAPTELTTAAPTTTAAPATTEAPETTAQSTEAPTTTAPSTAGSTEAPTTEAPTTEAPTSETEAAIDEKGSYTKKDDVALYIHTYGHLPDNFVTKKTAQEAGWSGGSLEPYVPGCCIGGDKFGNYEGLLPKKKGRTYYECDINTLGKSSRGAKRIIYSNDGWIYYTKDHYESFTCLYEGED